MTANTPPTNSLSAPETAIIDCPDCYAKAGEPCHHTNSPTAGEHITQTEHVIPFIHNVRAAQQAYRPEFHV